MFNRSLPPFGARFAPNLTQSIICDGGASMTRTFTSTSGDSWAIAIRRSKFGATQNVLSTSIQFDSSNRLVAFGRTSTRVFRDVGWYVFLFNPTSMYVASSSGGGMEEIAGTGTYAMASIVNPVLFGSASRFEGGCAGFWHADSVAWTTSAFVNAFEFDGQSITIADDPALTYGADGVRLLFANSAAFGTDTSGNGNDWTPTGFVAGDQTADVPGRPYAVWSAIAPSTGTISDGGRTSAGNATSTLFMETGKFYWEITANAVSVVAGVISEGGTATTTSVANGTTSGFRFDADTGALDVTTDGTNYTSVGTGLTGGRYARASGGSNTINSGLTAFTYTPPAGFRPLSTNNFETPLYAGGNWFDANIRTGTGAAYSVTTGPANGTDLVWAKGRSGATDHAWYDIVRGVQQQLECNTTTAETTETTGLTAFNSTGYTAGALAQINTNTATYVDWMWKAGGTGVANTDGTISSTVSVADAGHFSIVTWTGTGANGTVGHGLPGAPEMVIVKRRDSTGNWPVDHISLTAGNTMYLNLSANGQVAGATVWNSTKPTATVFSVGTSAETNASGGTYVAYCFRSVKGLCSVSSHGGNGSADGTLLELGFTPKWALFRDIGNSNNWQIYDTARNPINVMDDYLLAHISGAETSLAGRLIDMNSNSVKMRGSDNTINGAGRTYLHLIMADIAGGGDLPWPLAR